MSDNMILVEAIYLLRLHIRLLRVEHKKAPVVILMFAPYIWRTTSLKSALALDVLWATTFLTFLISSINAP